MYENRLLIYCVAILICFTGCVSTSPDLRKAANVAKVEGKPILITRLNPGPPNSASGVNMVLYWMNLSDKTVKYVAFSAVPYNAVGDPVKSEVGGETIFTGQVTGPIESGQQDNSSYWRNAWYNSSIKCLKLVKVDIEYMDGSRSVIDSEGELNGLLAPPNVRSYADGTCES